VGLALDITPAIRSGLEVVCGTGRRT
jgi:hypothetical protein